MTMRTSISALVAVTLCHLGISLMAGDPPTTGIYAQDNLVAWCIVPFDANKRGPAERAEMLARLGFRHVAYDWRAEHVATFEEEILQYKKHNLNYFAFWSWHDAMEPLIKKYGIRPQIWSTALSPPADTQQARVKAAANAVLPLVEKTRSLGCRFGLYNHGGWGGAPENLVAVCQYLREHHQGDHVGIVYNFHHGHEHMVDFRSQLQIMKPYLLCLNINGMDDAVTVAAGTNKILPVGSGRHELSMLQTVKSSGYDGPVGILDHRSNLDAEKSLRQNLDGLKKLVAGGL
ncbi:MAG: hypothetical protein P8K08_20175 [Fuerstiella sp.]|jgi:sugar phosphate isomerase/epimerase|nr:hypothetical protein [Fuerstiella sp.]